MLHSISSQNAKKNHGKRTDILLQHYRLHNITLVLLNPSMKTTAKQISQGYMGGRNYSIKMK